MKTFNLFKRDDDGRKMPADLAAKDRERAWNFRFTFRGKEYGYTLETPDAAEAQKRARTKFNAVTEAVISGDMDRLAGVKTRQDRAATLAELCRAYTGERDENGNVTNPGAPVDAGFDTRAANVAALLNLTLRVTRPDLDTKETPERREARAKLLALPFPEVLNKSMAQRFFAYTPPANATQGEVASAKRSINSFFAQASSLCAAKALTYYESLGLARPCLKEFLDAGLAQRFTRLPKVEYNPPRDDQIAATLKAWEDCEDRNTFFAVGFELSFGLRAGEMGQARWNWLTTRNGFVVLDGEAKVKNGSFLVQVKALDPFFTTMKTKALARGWWPTDTNTEDFIITGSDNYRDDCFEREVSAWMRGQGWKTKKTNHALRAYAGGQVAMKFGIYEAQMFLRHSSVKVTENNYGHFVRKFKPDNPDALPAKWATSAPAAPALKIYKAA